MLLLLLTGCSSDDFQWTDHINPEEEIAVVFRAATYQDVQVATRATEPSSTISHIYLLVYDGETLHYSKEFTSFTDSQLDAANKAATVKRKDVCEGTWVVVANGQKIIDDFKKEGSTTLTSLKNLLLSKKALIDDASNALMVGFQDISATNNKLPDYTSVFNLTRRFSKFTFKVKDDVKFLVTGVKLYREPSHVHFNSSPVTADLDGETTFETPSSYTGKNPQDNSKGYMTSADQIDFFSLPVSNKMPAGTGEYPEARLIIEGYSVASVDKDEEGNTITTYATTTSYFAYKFDRAIVANTHYTLTLEAVEGTGKDNMEEAVANPVGVAIEFKEETEPIKNMVTDGQNVIALPDTIYAGYEARSIDFSVTWRGNTSTDLQIFNEAGNELTTSPASLSTWAKVTRGTTSDDETEVDEEHPRKQTPFTLSLENNEGSERETSLTFKLSGIPNLEATVVIVQGIDDTMNLDRDLDITLTLSRTSGAVGGTLDKADYLKFIGNTEGGQSELLGIMPEQNGGRVRNAGLHFPMANGGVTYTYEVKAPGYTIDTSKLPTGITCTSSGDTHKFVFKDNEFPGSNKNLYAVYEDAITFTKGNSTLTLDIYHTGFFHQNGTNWFYYEVFTSNNQRWLDRNINATSAGMAHFKGSGLIGGEWPISSGAQGARFSNSDAANAIPAGYKIPTQGDFDKLTMQTNFTSDRFVSGTNTIFLPAYSFKPTVYRAGKPVSNPAMIRSFFPHNRYTNNNNVDGDDEAGYYWTTTQTGENYSRCYKFIGKNATAENMFTTDRNLSVRAMAGESVDDNTFTYSMQCKGYTHVFLYAEKNGEKTFLNTWPGNEVAIGDMATKRYNPFSYVSYMDYEAEGYKLYVILNNTSSGSTVSNVNPAAVKARNGIPLVNGGTYDINAEEKLVYPTTGSSYVISGNWISEPIEEPTKNWTVAFIWKKGQDNIGDKVNIWTTNYNDSQVVFGSWKTGTALRNDYYYITYTFEKVHLDFQYSGSTAENSTIHMFYDYDRDKRVWNNGNYHKRLSEIPEGVNADEAFLIWHNTQPADPKKSKYVLYCHENNTGDWKDLDMTESNGNWIYNNYTVTGESAFLIKKVNETTEYYKGSGSVTNNWSQKLTTDGQDLTLPAGTWNFSLNPSDMKLTVTSSSGDNQAYTLIYCWPQSLDEVNTNVAYSSYSNLTGKNNERISSNGKKFRAGTYDYPTMCYMKIEGVISHDEAIFSLYNEDNDWSCVTKSFKNACYERPRAQVSSDLKTQLVGENGNLDGYIFLEYNIFAI